MNLMSLVAATPAQISASVELCALTLILREECATGPLPYITTWPECDGFHEASE